MVKKSNRKRLLAVILSAVMALQPATMAFADEEIIVASDSGPVFEEEWVGTGEDENQTEENQEYTYTITLEEYTTPLNAKEAVEKLKGNVKVVSAMDGEEEAKDVTSDVIENVTFSWAAKGENDSQEGETEQWSETVPETAGTYQVKAVLSATETYKAAESDPIEVQIKAEEEEPTPEPEQKELILTLKQPAVSSLNAKEAIAELKKNVTVVVSALDGEGNNEDITASVIQDVKFLWTVDDTESETIPTTTGTYTVKAVLEETDTYKGATSESIEVELVVDEEPVIPEQKKEVIITLNPVSSLNAKEAVSVLKENVKVVVTSPNGEEVTDITDEVIDAVKFLWTAGDTESETMPTISGLYSVKAVLEASEDYEKAESNSIEVDLTVDQTEEPEEPEKIKVDIQIGYDGYDAQKNQVTTEYNGEEVDWTFVDAKAYIEGEPADVDLKAIWKSADGKEIAAPSEPGRYTLEIKPVDGDVYEGSTVIAVIIWKQAEADKDGKIAVQFLLEGVSENGILTTEYDGKSKDASVQIYNLQGYTGEVKREWSNEDGDTISANAVENVGTYNLTVSVPDDEKYKDYKGSAKFTVEITERKVVVSVEALTYESVAGTLADYEIKTENEVKDKFTWIQEPAVKVSGNNVEEGKTYTLVPFGADAGENYEFDYRPSKAITVSGKQKSIILDTDVDYKTTKKGFVYTGEPIQPTAVVTYNYTDAKQKAKKQKLKLNVDYKVSYRDNVNAGKNATMIVEGIGEYTGYVTKEFEIQPKDIKKAKISPVGDIKYGEKPVIVVNDGVNELIQGVDFKTDYDPSKTKETEDNEITLNVSGIGNYTGTIGKPVKFWVLKADTDKTSISNATVEFKKSKTYIYNGKAQKPAVTVTAGGAKLKGKAYKVVYRNNVNAGTAKVTVVGLSKGGYYGSKTITFDIGQKDFAKVKASNIKIPKTSDLNGATFTVKDGKRILVEGKDFTVKENVNEVVKKMIADKQSKTTFTLVAKSKNYTENSEKTVKVSLVMMNLASKTAKVTVTSLNGTLSSEKDVVVIYNGKTLANAGSKTGNGDYYVAKFKEGKSIKITAVKKGAYKGSRTFKKGTDY